MFYSGSANTEAILVLSQVDIYFWSNPVEDHSIESLGHDGAKADPAVVTALAEVPCFWYGKNVQDGPLVRFPPV